MARVVNYVLFAALTSIFRAAGFGVVGADAGRPVGLIVLDGYDESAGVARWAGFPGPKGLSGRLNS